MDMVEIQEVSVNRNSFFVVLFLIVLMILAGCMSVIAGDVPTAQSASVAGTWQISWQARLGTEQATIELVQNGSRLTGTFHDPRHSAPLSGTIEGRNISFDVEFTGGRPYTIGFKGAVDGDKITGTSQAKNIGDTKAYLGHGGEIVQPEHPWSAIRPGEPAGLRTAIANTGAAGHSN